MTAHSESHLQDDPVWTCLVCDAVNHSYEFRLEEIGLPYRRDGCQTTATCKYKNQINISTSASCLIADLDCRLQTKQPHVSYESDIIIQIFILNVQKG